MEVINFIFVLGLIIFLTKFLGLFMRKIGLPQVLGFIIAGVFIGPAIWELIFPGSIFTILTLEIQGSNELKVFAEVGVILVMFTAGLETDLNEIKKTGLVSLLIALGGVIIPLILGFSLGMIFFQASNIKILEAVFIGTIMTATSVGITVETLREIGKLKGTVGTTILSAAVIDDVIGIILLTVVMSFSSSSISTGESTFLTYLLQFINPNFSVLFSILWMIIFFIVAIGGGIFIAKYFSHMEKKHPKTRRQIIYSLALCFFYSFMASKIFGVADITGAYIAGVLLSTNNRAAQYVDKRVNTNTYLIFGPIFFANIGIQLSFNGFDFGLVWFGIVFIIIAVIGKVAGCGLVAKACKFGTKDSLKIGVGMIARGEVALIMANLATKAGILESKYLTIVVVAVLICSVLPPIFLKMLFKSDVDVPTLAETNVSTPVVTECLPSDFNPTQFDL